MANKPNQVLKIKTRKEAKIEAIKRIEQERTGNQLGLITRFSKLNIAAGKYFRFGYISLIAGLSGHGKSTILNMIEQDFLNEDLNKHCVYDYVLVKFAFEMKASDEILRETSSELGVSYNYLISSEYQSESKDYNSISDEEINKIKEQTLKTSKKDNIIYIEEPGTVTQIYNTILSIHKRLNSNREENNPVKLVVTLDHSLLVNKDKEKSDIDLMANLAKMFIIVKKQLDAMIILVGQLNNKLEEVVRLKEASLHFPMKSDIYAQAQIYNACDDVYIIHRPSLLGLKTYSTKKFPTKDLVHLLKLKGRFGKVGSIWLKGDFSKGRITEDFLDVETDENISKINE